MLLGHLLWRLVCCNYWELAHCLSIAIELEVLDSEVQCLKEFVPDYSALKSPKAEERDFLPLDRNERYVHQRDVYADLFL